MSDFNYTETEEKIFQAALKIFARDGKKGTTMQEIANEAGINKALVHYYFRTKDKLYDQVFRYILGKYFTSLGESIIHETEFIPMLRAFISKYIDMVMLNPNLPKFMVKELSEGAVALRGKLIDFIKEGELSAPQILLQKFNESKSKNEIRDVDPIQLINTIIGACVIISLNIPIVTIIDPAINKNLPEFIEARKRHVFDIILNGIKFRPEDSE